MYLKGIPVPKIMAISGHKTEKNFYKYIKADGMEHAKMMKRMLTNPTTQPTETVPLSVHPKNKPLGFIFEPVVWADLSSSNIEMSLPINIHDYQGYIYGSVWVEEG